MIKVMRIIDRLNVGGPAIHAVITTKGLDPTRFRTVLVVGSVEGGEADMSYLLEQHGITGVEVVPSLGRELRPARDLVTAWRLFTLMRRERPDVVHTHKAKAGAVGRLVARLCGVPVLIHTFHGHVLDGYFGVVKTAVFRGIERGLARITSRLVTPSRALADELAGRHGIGSVESYEVVPLGFDLAPFAACDQHRGLLRAELGIGPEVPLVGIVGRMVPIKDHATFIDAAADLAQRRPEVRFVFVGGGELEQAVRARIAEKGIGGCCHLLGWRRDLPRLYADLDVVALSSRNEGTPVSLIEAMACGVPVAATAVGGVPDVLQGGARGELVPVGDPRALSASIERLLTPEARARAAQVRPQVMVEYGAQRLCHDLEQLYERLLAAAGRPGGAGNRPA